MLKPPLTNRYMKYLFWDAKRKLQMGKIDVIGYIKCQYNKKEIEDFLIKNPKYLEYFV